MRQLPNYYKKLLVETEIPPEPTPTSPTEDEMRMEPGTPFGDFRTWESVPSELFLPIDQTFNYGIIDRNQTLWLYLQNNGDGTYEFLYRGRYHDYRLQFDINTGKWTRIGKPILREKEFEGLYPELYSFGDDSETWPLGQYGPPYGRNITEQFGRFILITSQNKYYKWNETIGRYEQINYSDIPQVFHDDIQEHTYDPSIYNQNGTLRGIEWWQDRYLPWWVLRFSKPLPSIFQQITDFLTPPSYPSASPTSSPFSQPRRPM